MTTTLAESTQDTLQRHATAVDAYMESFVARLDLPDNLREAIAYALLGGGKRLRPVLCRMCAELVGAPADRATPAATALELVHAFSLVHDDLPAMDDDAMRRGRPTLHVHAGEAMAILAGDAMLALAFRVLAESPPAGEPYAHAERALLMDELADATTGMIAGQVYDTLGGFESTLTDEDRVRLTHRCKTGALLRGACRMGAILGARPDIEANKDAATTIDAVSRFGDAIGLMYQVVDDLIDVEQTDAHAGKRTGKDAEAGKLTYPSVLGVDRSRELVDRLTSDARAALAVFGSRAEPILATTEYLANRTR